LLKAGTNILFFFLRKRKVLIFSEQVLLEPVLFVQARLWYWQVFEPVLLEPVQW
jgi:hypothetical protein